MNLFRSDEERDAREALASLRQGTEPVLTKAPSLLPAAGTLALGILATCWAFLYRAPDVPALPKGPVALDRMFQEPVDRPERIPVPAMPTSALTLRTIADPGIPSTGIEESMPLGGGKSMRLIQVRRMDVPPVSEEQTGERALRLARALSPNGRVVNENEVRWMGRIPAASFAADVAESLRDGRAFPPGVDMSFVGRHPRPVVAGGWAWKVSGIGTDAWPAALERAISVRLREDATESWRGEDVPARSLERRPFPDPYRVEVTFGSRTRTARVPLAAVRSGDTKLYLAPVIREYAEWAKRTDGEKG